MVSIGAANRFPMQLMGEVQKPLTCNNPVWPCEPSDLAAKSPLTEAIWRTWLKRHLELQRSENFL